MRNENLSTSIITLIKRKQMTNSITKQDSTICRLKETHLRFKDTNGLKVKDS